MLGQACNGKKKGFRSNRDEETILLASIAFGNVQIFGVYRVISTKEMNLSRKINVFTIIDPKYNYIIQQ